MSNEFSNNEDGRISLACLFGLTCIALLSSTPLSVAEEAGSLPHGATEFIGQHCADGHDTESKEGGLNLTALKFAPGDRGSFATWVKVFDRASTGEMPPVEEPRPQPADLSAFTRSVSDSLIAFEQEHTVIPVNGYESQYELFGQEASKFTVGDSDPATREIEGFVQVASQANNYLMWFDEFSAPVAGRYRIRLNAFSARIGPSSREPGMPHQWWIPDLANVMPSSRTEPVTVYAETYPRK